MTSAIGSRDEAIAPRADARESEAIVPAIDPDDPDPRRRLPGRFTRRGIGMSPLQQRALTQLNGERPGPARLGVVSETVARESRR